MKVIQAGDAQAKATGNGVKVGVIDGGVDFSHPDLAGGIDVDKSCSFIFDTTPTADPQEIANGDAIAMTQTNYGFYGNTKLNNAFTDVCVSTSGREIFRWKWAVVTV